MHDAKTLAAGLRARADRKTGGSIAALTVGYYDMADAAFDREAATALDALESESIEGAEIVGELKGQLSALQEEVGRLREALEPFADYASQDGFGLDYHGRELPDGDGPGWVYVTNGDFRRARSALARTAGGKDD